MQEILDFWFPTKDNASYSFWFDKSKDEFITTNYKHLVDNMTIDNYKSFITNDNSKIALLIVGDQMTRNIYRDTIYKTKNDIWVLELALDLINNNKDLEYPLNHRYFILLPLRHAKQSKLLDITISRLKIYFKSEDCKSLQKFYQNTIKNYTDLTDTIMVGRPLEYNEVFQTILEKYETKYKSDCKVVFNAFNKFKSKNIGLSLSGGVDSMVLLDVLKKNGANVVAIHIEYANRDEAKLERQFLEYYCHKLNVKLYYRTIDYMERKDVYIDREIFEQETRKVRFNLYKFVIEKEKLEGICLGHHSGDVVENVFTNLIKGRSIYDFAVMKEIQEQDNVNIFRPFLQLTKDTIIQFAQSNSIPYFLNSTPKWSCRGVLRDTVIPILKKQFGDFEPNIIKFTKECSTFTKPINNKIVLDYGVKVEYNKNISYELLLDIMHSYGYHMISHKSKNNFMLWLQNPTNQFELGKHVFCYLYNDYLYFINYSKIVNDKPKKQVLLDMFDNYLSPKINKL